MTLAAIAALFTTFSSLTVGCSAPTPETHNKKSAPATAAASTATAATTAEDAPTDDPAAASKTVEVRIGEPLLEVRTSGGYTVGGVLGKNGLTQADLGAVLADKANAGMIGARCSVSVPNQTVADAVADRLDGGVDAAALRGSSVFYNVLCVGTPDYRVLKTGTLRLPDHGRAALGQQLVGAHGNIASLGKTVGALTVKIDRATAVIAATSDKVSEIDTAVENNERRSAEARANVIAFIALLLIAAAIGSVVFFLYRWKHPRKAMGNQEVSDLINKTVEATAKRLAPDLEAVTARASQATREVIKPAELVATAVQTGMVSVTPTLEANSEAMRLATEALAKAAAASAAQVEGTKTLERLVLAHARKCEELDKEEAALVERRRQLEARERRLEAGGTAPSPAPDTPPTRRETSAERRLANEASAEAPAFQPAPVPTLAPAAAEGPAMSMPVVTSPGLGGLLQLAADVDADMEADDGGDHEAHEPSPPTRLGAGMVGREDPSSQDLDQAPPGDGSGDDPHSRKTVAYATAGVQQVDGGGVTEEETVETGVGTDDDHDADDGDVKTTVAVRSLPSEPAARDGVSGVLPLGTAAQHDDARASQPARRETFNKAEVGIDPGDANGLSFVCQGCNEKLADADACDAHKREMHYRCLVCVNKPVLVGLNAWMQHTAVAHPSTDADATAA